MSYSGCLNYSKSWKVYMYKKQFLVVINKKSPVKHRTLDGVQLWKKIDRQLLIAWHPELSVYFFCCP